MAPARRRRALALTLALVLALAGSAEAGPSRTTPTAALAELEAQLAALQQQLAALSGSAPAPAAAAGGEGAPGAAAPSGGGPFVPPTTNTRRTLATRAAAWPAHWAFAAAVAADALVTAAHVLRGPDAPLYVVAGDAAGWLYFFTPAGNLVHEHDTGARVAVTALASQSLRSNMTQLVVGLRDGGLLVLVLGHESAGAPDGSGVSSVTLALNSTAADRAEQAAAAAAAVAGNKAAAPAGGAGGDSEGAAVTHVVTIKYARRARRCSGAGDQPRSLRRRRRRRPAAPPPRRAGRTQQRRLLAVIDAAGRLALLAPASGRVLLTRELPAPALAVSAHTEHQLVVQTGHMAVVVLLSRGRGRVQRPCVGLTQPGGGGSLADVLVAAAFDPVRSFRAYGVTAGGELLVLSVPGAHRTSFCKVVQRLPLGLPPGPVRLVVAGRGRLVLLHAEGVATFDTTHPVQLQRSHLVSHTWQELWALYGLSRHFAQQQGGAPAAAGAQAADDGAGRALLHTAAGAADGLAAAGDGELLLLPFGRGALAAFTAGGVWGGGGSGGGGPGGWGGGGGGGDGGFAWMRMLQPAVVVMMVGVGVWQFLRASSSARHGPAGVRGRGLGGYGGGALDGLSPADLGEVGLPHGLFGAGGGGLGSLGGFGGLDDDLGAYGGPRASRLGGAAAGAASAFDGGGALGAFGARRRAHAIMRGRPEPQPRGGGAGAARAAAAAAGAQLRAARAAGGGILAGAGVGRAGGAAAGEAARRVRFAGGPEAEELALGSDGEDDIGRVPAPAGDPGARGVCGGAGAAAAAEDWDGEGSGEPLEEAAALRDE
ncbi:hypothetical protein HT031_004335 [Scenedesmus sp. PABB004]|nr:hypothetical protein HT031_004335 [Scenedesmus sp. PABB004]